MLIGQRLRDIRKAKNLSQDDIARATGFARPYISRVENGHIVPRIEILKEWAGALGMPLYQILYEGEEPPKPLKFPDGEEWVWGSSGREAHELVTLRRSLSKMTEADRKILLALAGRMARGSRLK
jgi:transcriptional regulator with XRE-family HTH domain